MSGRARTSLSDVVAALELYAGQAGRGASQSLDPTGTRAAYTDTESDCSLFFTFTPATVKIEQQKGDCGFGYNVHADGFYLKISNAAPKIDE